MTVSVANNNKKSNMIDYTQNWQLIWVLDHSRIHLIEELSLTKKKYI